MTYAIEVQQFDPATHKFHWTRLKTSALCSRPDHYNSHEKAQRVVDICFPEKYAVKARVVEVHDEDR